MSAELGARVAITTGVVNTKRVRVKRIVEPEPEIAVAEPVREPTGLLDDIRMSIEARRAAPVDMSKILP